jgi:hypothetical protein
MLLPEVHDELVRAAGAARARRRVGARTISALAAALVALLLAAPAAQAGIPLVASAAPITHVAGDA